MEIDTSGRLLAGGGNVVLDRNGLSFVAETVYSAESNIAWFTGSYEEATISFYSPAYAGGFKYLSIVNGYTLNKASEVLVEGVSSLGYDSNMTLSTRENGTLNRAEIYLSTDNADFGESIMLIANRTVITGQATLAEGLIVGHTGVTPTSDQIRLYRGGTLMGQLSTNDTTYLRINQDVAKDIYTPRMFVAADGLSASLSVDPGSGGIGYSGNIVRREGTVNYTCYSPPVMLSSRLTILNNVTRTSANNDFVTLTGVPTGVSYVIVSLSVNPTAAGGWAALGPSSTQSWMLVEYTGGGSVHQQGHVKTNGTNSIYVKYSGTCNNVFLYVLGYGF